MKTYRGGCHCRRVRFEVQTDLTSASACNCSICTKKGALHHSLPAERFTLLRGESELTLYQFGTQTARHWFCKHCGIQAFSNPRTAPEKYSVNVRCLDDFPDVAAAITVTEFDGQHWEEAFANLKR